MAALLAGQGVNDVARQYHLHPSTVSRIKAKLQPGELQQVATEKLDELGSLIAGVLHSALGAMDAITTQVAQPGYIAKQDAGQIGVLYGIIADKSIRILEAAQAGVDPDQPDV